MSFSSLWSLREHIMTSHIMTSGQTRWRQTRWLLTWWYWIRRNCVHRNDVTRELLSRDDVLWSVMTLHHYKWCLFTKLDVPDFTGKFVEIGRQSVCIMNDVTNYVVIRKKKQRLSTRGWRWRNFWVLTLAQTVRTDNVSLGGTLRDDTTEQV